MCLRIQVDVKRMRAPDGMIEPDGAMKSRGVVADLLQQRDVMLAVKLCPYLIFVPCPCKFPLHFWAQA